MLHQLSTLLGEEWTLLLELFLNFLSYLTPMRDREVKWSSAAILQQIINLSLQHQDTIGSGDEMAHPRSCCSAACDLVLQLTLWIKNEKILLSRASSAKWCFLWGLSFFPFCLIINPEVFLLLIFGCRSYMQNIMCVEARWTKKCSLFSLQMGK